MTLGYNQPNYMKRKDIYTINMMLIPVILLFC